MSLQELVKCPKCGSDVTVHRRSHNPRGTGARYASQITRLNRMHELCLEVLRANKCYDFNSGLSLTDVWLKIRELCTERHIPIPTKQGVSGRLSELQGLGCTKSQYNRIELVDRQSMSFRAPKGSERWILTERGR